MKKMITALTAVSLAASMMTPLVSFAGFADNQNTSKASTTYAETYVITIPANVSSDSGAAMNINVAASDVLLDPGNELKVTVAASGTMKNEADETTTLAYSLKKGDEAVTDAPFLTIASGTTEGSADLTVTVDGTPTKAGTYSDTLTFTASVAEAQAQAAE